MWFSKQCSFYEVESPYQVCQSFCQLTKVSLYTKKSRQILFISPKEQEHTGIKSDIGVGGRGSRASGLEFPALYTWLGNAIAAPFPI